MYMHLMDIYVSIQKLVMHTFISYVDLEKKEKSFTKTKEKGVNYIFSYINI